KIVYLGNVLQLSGSSVDPDSTPTVTWSQASGPGTAAFGDTSSPVTNVSFDVAGVYVLQLQSTDGTSVVKDDITVYVIDHAYDALVAHWDFDGLAADANTLTDVSGNGLDGTYYSVSHGDPVVVAGHIAGSAAAADLAADSYWDIGDPNLTNTETGITIAAWVNIDVNTGYPMIVGYGLDGWRLQVSDNKWNFVCTPAGINLMGTYPPIDGFWHHISAVYDGVNSRARIYVDGLLNAEQNVLSGVLLSKGAQSLQVGSRADGPRIWPGLIDDIQIFNYPLSDSAIAALAGKGDVLPLLTAGEDQTLQYTGTGIQLDATIYLNDGMPSPLALNWEVISAPGGVNLGDVVFNDNTIEDPTVTFPNAPGTYTFRLTGDDTVVQVSDEVSIVVFIPTCAQVLADGLRLAADLSGPSGQPDCYIDMYDLVAIASGWLNCNNPQDVTCMWPY
ncbi:MAG: LamG domain-containing protein, partial [Sedimentisphaerales bacterium]|nr:LamG domain-containing protein [Sedimentisphaerales bacterium]